MLILSVARLVGSRPSTSSVRLSEILGVSRDHAAQQLVFARAEVVARLVWRGRLADVRDGSRRHRRTVSGRNRGVARRWFAARVASRPMPEPFATRKAARSYRVFVLGESSTAGFPYPRNGTFSRVLRDMLRDVLPEDSVEVVNLGMAATNSYALADIASEVLAQSPDAVVIYAGITRFERRTA